MGPQNSDPNSPPANPVQSDLSSSFNPPPATPEPASPTLNITQPDPISLPQTPVTPEPPATPSFDSFTPPAPTPTEPPTEPIPQPSSPLDNPMGMPTQTPTIDGGGTEASGFNWSNPAPTPEPVIPIPPTVSTPPEPVTPNFAPPPMPEAAQVTPTDSAPTDLSQLAQTSEPQPVYTAPLSQPETLVVPPSTPEPTTLQTDGGGHSIPKWVYAVGAALLLLVLGASAYFILGIGQTPAPESLPATEQQTLITPPVASPAAQVPAATSSAGFGSFASPSPTQQATSAAELLRQRQQAQ